MGAFLREARQQFLPQAVLPGAQRLGDAPFDSLDVDRDVALGVGAHQCVEACERRLRDLHLRLERVPGQLVEQDLLDALAGQRVVSVAGHVQLAREEPLVRVATHEQAHAPALVDVDDAARAAHELGHACLEELVARIAFQHVEKGLAVVAHRSHADLVDHALHLLAQQRDLARARAVGRGREQAEEAAFAGDAAARIEGLHADVVEVGRPMHRRDRIRLRDDERGLLACHAPGLAAQHRRPRPGPALAGAEQPEPRSGDRHELVRRRASRETVFAKTEESEMMVGEPGQESARLGGLRAADAGQSRPDAAREFQRLVRHGLPVAHRKPYVGEHGEDACAHVREPARIHGAVDLDVLPGLRARADRRVAGAFLQATAAIAHNVQHRVHHHVQRESAVVQHHGQRVDEKRHVVRDDLDHGVRRGPAVLGLAGIEDTYQRPAGAADRAETQLVDRGCGERGRCAAAQVVLVHAAVVRLHEVRGRHGRARLRGSRVRRDRIDQVLAYGRDDSCHCLVPRVLVAALRRTACGGL